MSIILDEVNAENLEKLRNEQKSVIKNLLEEREEAEKSVDKADKNLIEVVDKLGRVSKMNEETFKDSKFRKQEIWGENPFFKARDWSSVLK